MALGPSVYKMVLDSRNFVDGVVLTRKELALQKAVLAETKPLVESYGDTIDRMAALVRKGALTADEYNQANRALRAELPENATAMERVNEALRKGESVRDSLKTADDRLAESERQHIDALAANEQLFRDNAQSAEEYHEKLERLLAVSPEVLDQERQRADALKHSQDILNSLKTEEDKYTEARERARAALEAGGISQQQYEQHLTRLEARLPDAIAKERELAEAERERAGLVNQANTILDRNRTTEEKLAIERTRARNLLDAKVLSERDYERELSRINAMMPAAIEAERRRADAINRGRQLTEQYLPVWRRAGIEMRELHAHYQAGLVDVHSYRNGMVQLAATQATGIPIVGQFASAVANVHPALIAVGVAAAGVTAGVGLLSGAVAYSTRQIREQLTVLDDAMTAAQTLSLPVDQFMMLAHAADRADIEQQQLATGIEQMAKRVSDAAFGKGESVQIFSRIGIDARQLQDQRPDKILEEITRGIDGMANATDRLQASKDIFGTADFLRLNVGDIRRADELLDSINYRLTEVDKHNFDQMDVALKDLNFLFDSAWQKVAIRLTPAINDAAQAGMRLIQDVAGDDRFDKQLEKWEKRARGVVGTLEAMASAAKSLAGEAGDFFDPTGIARGIGSGMLDNLEAYGILKDVEDRIRQTNATGDGDRSAGGATNEHAIAAATLNEKLREQIALVGKSATEAEIYKLAQQGVAASKLDTARALSAELAAAEKAHRLTVETAQAEERRRAAVGNMLAQLEDEHAKLTMSERAYRDYAAAKAGAGLVERVWLDALSQQNEQLEKQVEAARKRETAVRGIITGLEDEVAKLSMSEAALRDRELVLAGATAQERDYAATLAATADRLGKQRDAAKMAEDAIADLEKQIRQAGMSPDERQIDDLKQAGVEEHKLRLIKALQEELSLEEAIRDTRFSGTAIQPLKVGSMEAELAKMAAWSGAMMRIDAAFGAFETSRPGWVEARPTEPKLTKIEPTPDAAIDRSDSLAEAVDPFEEAYRLMGKTDPLKKSDVEDLLTRETELAAAATGAAMGDSLVKSFAPATSAAAAIVPNSKDPIGAKIDRTNQLLEQLVGATETGMQLAVTEEHL